MPVKKFSDCTPALQEVTNLISNQLANAPEGNTSPINLLALTVIIIFFGMITFQVSASMDEKFTVTDKEAKSCLLDFQTKNCDALDLDGECQRLFSCIQKEEGKEDKGIGTKMKHLIAVSLKELSENYLFPSILLGLIFLYQIAKALLKKESKKKGH